MPTQVEKLRKFQGGKGGLTSTPWNGNSKGVGALKQKCPPWEGIRIFSAATHYVF